MIQRVRFKIPKLQYMRGKRSFGVKVDINEGTKILLVLKEPLPSVLPTVEFTSKVKLNNELEFMGKFKLRPNESKNLHFIVEVSQIQRAMEKAFQEHLTKLFRYTGPNELKLDVMRCGDNLPEIINVSNSCIFGQTIDIRRLEMFLAKYPNLKSLNMSATIVNPDGDLLESSRIFQVPNICIQSQWGFDLLRKFTGRNLALSNIKLNTSDIILFLNKWVNSERYQELETLCIGLEDGRFFNVQLITTALVMDTYNTANLTSWPETVPYDSKITYRRKVDIFIRNHGTKRIRRKSDNKMAFLQCTLDCFRFIVYNE